MYVYILYMRLPNDKGVVILVYGSLALVKLDDHLTRSSTGRVSWWSSQGLNQPVVDSMDLTTWAMIQLLGLND